MSPSAPSVLRRRVLVAFLPFLPAAALMTIGWWIYGLVVTLALGAAFAAVVARTGVRRPALAGLLGAAGLVLLNVIVFVALCAAYCD